MIKKISKISFIFLMFFLISSTSAANLENETQNIDLPHASDSESNKHAVNLTVEDVEMYYKDGTRLEASLRCHLNQPMNGEHLSFNINGIKYTKTVDSNGMTSIPLNLNSGTYHIITTYNGNDRFENASVNSTVIIKSTIIGKNITKVFRNETQYSATFYDNKGNTLIGRYVDFNINGVMYTRTTDDNGIAKLNLNLPQGEYILTAINPETNEMHANLITILPTICENRDLIKFYKNNSQYSVKLIDKLGNNVRSGESVVFNINGVFYTRTTNDSGIATLNINLYPGNYIITANYKECYVSNLITIYSTLYGDDLVMSYNDGSCFKALVLNGTGNPSSKENVTFNINGVFYTKTTNDNGVASLKINLDVGQYTITSEYNGYKISNRISIYENFDEELKNNEFTYEIQIPKFENQKINVRIGTRSYSFMNINSTFINFDGSINGESDYGVSIKDEYEYISINYYNNCSQPIELFGSYINPLNNNSAIITYIQNDKKTAEISYGINNSTELITLFTTKDNQVEKIEKYTNGNDNRYNKNNGFEILQGYAIISKKVDCDTAEQWLDENPSYLNEIGQRNVYGMFLAGLEVGLLSDIIANNYAGIYNVSWNRNSPIVIMGGINLDNVYIHILNASMAMNVDGENETNIFMFKLVNSLNLPNVESNVLQIISNRFKDNSTNTLEILVNSVKGNVSSAVFLDDYVYIFCEEGENLAIVIDCNNGVASVLNISSEFAYKGAAVSTSDDCCNVGIIPKDIISDLRAVIENGRDIVYSVADTFDSFNVDWIFDKIHPISIFLKKSATFTLGLLGKLTFIPVMGTLSYIIAPILGIQEMGTYYKDNIADEKDTYSLYNQIAFTRPGYLQNKKIYNIPNDKNGYDYIEVPINDDNSLNRDHAIYYSKDSTRNLSKSETYKYFDEESWTPFNVPKQYWDSSWQGAI